MVEVVICNHFFDGIVQVVIGFRNDNNMAVTDFYKEIICYFNNRLDS